ncbi:RidA family protein [Streptomyces sp. NPDC057438]|uniref:RidA family protein n=1 Tax=Streptomyces sp. NPDC057438 TaxID=3346133 RepID=UPI00367A9AAF
MGSQAKTFGFGMPWESSYGYSQTTQVGDTVYVSGQLSHDRDGNFVGADDHELQVRTTLANLDLVLEQVGAERSQIDDKTAECHQAAVTLASLLMWV